MLSVSMSCLSVMPRSTLVEGSGGRRPRRVHLIHAPPSYPTSPRFMLVGDSMVKHILDMPYTEVFSIRGAQISTLQRFFLTTKIDYEVVVVHVGTNCFRSPMFVDDFSELVEIIKQRSVFVNVQVWISSILPRPCDSDLQVSIGGATMTVAQRLAELNNQLCALAVRTPGCKFLHT